jgi:hypothetical protein
VEVPDSSEVQMKSRNVVVHILVGLLEAHQRRRESHDLQEVLESVGGVVLQFRRQLFEFECQIFQESFWASFLKKKAIVDIWELKKLQEVNKAKFLGSSKHLVDQFILSIHVFIYEIMLICLLGLNCPLLKRILRLWQRKPRLKSECICGSFESHDIAIYSKISSYLEFLVQSSGLHAVFQSKI